MQKNLIALLLAPVIAQPVYAADATDSSHGTQVEIVETIYYASGENSPRPSVGGRLQDFAQSVAGKSNLHIDITGHADEVALIADARRIFGDNLGLSTARASEVEKLLRAHAGLSEARIRTVGKGASSPKVSCKKTASMSAYQACLEPNRRVEIRARYNTLSVTHDSLAAVPTPEVSAPLAVAAPPASLATATPAIVTKNFTDPAEQAALTQPDAGAHPALAALGYVSVELGKVNYRNTRSHYDGGAFANPLSLRVAGGYFITPYFAVESGYAALSQSRINGTGGAVVNEVLRNRALHLTAVGLYSLNPQWDVFGKLGINHTQLNYSYVDARISGSGSASKMNPLLGVGVQYNFNTHHSVRVQVENFGKTKLASTFSNGSSNASNIGPSVLSVGWLYNFL